MSLFGEREMKEFAENSNDERVKAMWRRLQESKSNAAKWCDAFNNIQADAKRYRFIRDCLTRCSPMMDCQHYFFFSHPKSTGNDLTEAIDKEMKRMGYE